MRPRLEGRDETLVRNWNVLAKYPEIQFRSNLSMEFMEIRTDLTPNFLLRIVPDSMYLSIVRKET
jgi:hypothetical protein